MASAPSPYLAHPRLTVLRIGIDIRLSHGTSGQQRYLWRLGEWLADQGHEVHLCCTVNAVRSGPTPPGCRVHDWSRMDRADLAKAVREAELDVLLLNPERSPHYDGIRANVLRPGYGTDQFLQKLRSIPNPISRGFRKLLRELPPRRGKRARERRFYRVGGDEPEIIAISRYMREQVLASYPVSEDRIHLVPNGVDTEVFSPERRLALRDEMRAEFGIPEGAVCLLTVAHNFRLKGVRQALGHLARLRAEGVDAHLVVAGRGTGRTQMMQALRWADGAGVSDALHMPGEVSPAIRAFAAADAFLHLSWHDAFGFVVLEAMATGLPPLTTPWAGASMLVEHGVNGLVADPADDGAVYRALRALLENGEAARMGEAARATAEQYTEERNFRGVLEVMRTAAERTGAPVR
jgi:UDP-glucose:(heptosyl)LPS alpha-1,3-glucosyltransferase